MTSSLLRTFPGISFLFQLLSRTMSIPDRWWEIICHPSFHGNLFQTIDHLFTRVPSANYGCPCVSATGHFPPNIVPRQLPSTFLLAHPFLAWLRSWNNVHTAGNNPSVLRFFFGNNFLVRAPCGIGVERSVHLFRGTEKQSFENNDFGK